MNSSGFIDALLQALGIQPVHSDSYEVIKRVLFFVLVLVLQYALIRITNFGYTKLKIKLDSLKTRFIQPVYVKKYEFLSIDRQEKILFFFLNIFRWIVIIIQLLISIPILFSIFPQTENFAMQIVSYILTPLKKIIRDVLHYIPNLFIIVIIWLLIHYIIKGLAYLSEEIAQERLKIKGFYSDWAKPTFSIIRFLLYAFMISLIYPYLPNSQSGIFQGISIFVGVIVSFGSSSAIGNIIAGIIITYMRPFQVGDWITFNSVMGNVLERTPVVTRIRTLKNEIITIPNATIMNSQTTNLSESARTKGLIVHFSLTLGYEIPWRQIHQLLIEAALNTPDVLPNPQPFVLEEAFNDFSITYQINAYINDPGKLSQVTSGLRQNIQDKFGEAGVAILSPHYYTMMPAPEITPRPPAPDQ